MYLLIFAILIIFSILTFISKKKYYIIFNLLLVILFLMSGFRFGGNGDYFNYLQFYINAPTKIDLIYLGMDIHVEVGYKLLMIIFRSLDLSFTMLNLFISIFELYCIRKFIINHSNKYIISLLFFYCIFYGTYFCGAIRQGLAISIFVGFMVDALSEKKYIKYFLFNLIAMSFHTSSIILLILPLVATYKFELSFKSLFMLILMIPVYSIAVNQISSFITSTYLDSVEFSFFNVFSTLFLIIVIIYIFNMNKNDILKDKAIFSCFFYGVIVYMLFILYPTAGQRLFVYFYILLIVIIPIHLKFRKSKYSNVQNIYNIIFSVLILFCTIMFFKNQSMYISWNRYKGINVFNYPYINVFNEDRFYKYVDEYPTYYKDIN